MFTAEGLQVSRTDFFFTFEDELHVAVHKTKGKRRLEALDLDHRLALVVVGATCPDVTVTYFWFEWFALPEVKWLGGHHVVVTIDEKGW